MLISQNEMLISYEGDLKFLTNPVYTMKTAYTFIGL